MVDKVMPEFSLDDDGDVPIWVQLRDRFVYLIASGFYGPGDQLPSVRKVAAELRISYNTVSKAFMSLEREGHIVTQRGSGAYVADAAEESMGGLNSIADSFVRTCSKKGLAPSDISQLVARAIQRSCGDDER